MKIKYYRYNRYIMMLLVLICTTVMAEVRITEVMTCNLSTIRDNNQEYSPYIEFYNDGDEINLKYAKITNYRKQKVLWTGTFERKHTIKNGYNILFFNDGDEKIGSYGNMGSYSKKLSIDEGRIEIIIPDGDTIAFDYPKQYAHLSYGPEGYMEPTPGTENSQGYNITERVSKPEFDINKPGMYEDKTSLEISIKCDTEDANIYYTLNGSIPTPNDSLYTEPFVITKNTPIRIKAFRNDLLSSEIETGTFLLYDEHYDNCEGERLPIVAIVADTSDLYNEEYGISTNWKQSWSRCGNFEMFVDGNRVENKEVEIKLAGNSAKINIVKSLKVKANKKTGQNHFNYNGFLIDKQIPEYKSLMLRSRTYWHNFIKMADEYATMIAKQIKNLDMQDVRHVTYYLNGEWNGGLGLRETTSEDFCYHNYGLDKEDIELIDYDKLENYESYNNMFDFIKTNNQSDSFYNELNDKYMDIEEFMNYTLLQQFVVNSDWPYNNLKMWRLKDGGRFRWILYDIDFAFCAYYDYHPEYNYMEIDMMKWCMGICEKKNYPIELPFAFFYTELMKNEDIQIHYVTRFRQLLDNEFSVDKLKQISDSLETLIIRDNCSDKTRNLFPDVDLSKLFYDMTYNALQRRWICKDQLNSNFGMSYTPVSIKTKVEGGDGKVTCLFNKIFTVVDTFEYSALSGQKIKVEPMIYPGYKFKNWMIVDIAENDTTYSDILVYKADADRDIELTLVITKDEEYHPLRLFINEVCASNNTLENEFGKTADWIELYNGEVFDVCLSGLSITNTDKGLTTNFTTDTVVPSGGHLLLWADKKENSGDTHLNFKLSAAIGQRLELSYVVNGIRIVVDSMVYIPHAFNESYGRECDGCNTLSVFRECDGKSLDNIIPSPGKRNGETCVQNNVKDELSNNIASIVPNPFSDWITITLACCNVGSIKIYDANGELVLASLLDSKSVDINVSILNKGYYTAVVETNGSKEIFKMIKK